MTRSFALILVILIGACGGEPQFNLDEKAKPQFAPLPGKIGITIENNSGRWHHIIRGAALIKVSSLPEAPDGASGGYGSGAAGLPKQPGYIYKGPNAASPDNRYMAGSIGVRLSDPAPWGFVIIDTRTKKAIAKIKVYDSRENRYYIDGLAWSPDSNWVAVLKHSSRKGFSLIFEGLLGPMGHGGLYMTYYLEVFSPHGDLIAQTKLTNDVPDSWGWVVWME